MGIKLSCCGIRDDNVNNESNYTNLVTNNGTNINDNNLIDFKDVIRFRNKSGYYYVYSVYDGDTFTILMPLIFKSFSCYKNSSKEKLSSSVNVNTSTDKDEITFYKVSIRLAGVDAYEMHPKKNCENREEHLLKGPLGKEFIKNLILNKYVFLEFTKDNDPYARPIAKTFFNNKNIADMLIEKKLGVAYNGGKKTI